MARRVPFFLRGRKPLSLAVQLGNLQEMFPKSQGHVRNGELHWGFDAFSPMELCATYTIEIEGRRGHAPTVWLSGGCIDESNIKRIPHKYGIDEVGLRVKVCLEKGDWQVDQLYARTSIPWAMEWIVHFEIWCATGEWTGGGIHPESKDEHQRGKEDDI